MILDNLYLSSGFSNLPNGKKRPKSCDLPWLTPNPINPLYRDKIKEHNINPLKSYLMRITWIS